MNKDLIHFSNSFSQAALKVSMLKAAIVSVLSLVLSVYAISSVLHSSQFFLSILV